ncbi:MAG: metallophosphoesterase [Myxococcota bacterium]
MLIALLWVACRGDPPLRMVEGPTLTARDPAAVRFVALGDAGKANATQRQVGKAAVAYCARRGCDFVVLLGDLVYPRGFDAPDDPDAEARIVDPYAAAGVPILAVPGNHDYAHGSDRQRVEWLLDWAARRDDVVLPGHAWRARVGDVHLVGLDTADAIRFGAEPQLGWLEATLASMEAEERRPWIVAFGHHPRWSNGPHGNAGTYEGWSNIPWMSGTAVQRLLEPLESRAQLYLAGHDHSRQLIDQNAMVQIVSGAGASATPIVDRGNTPRFARATAGFVWVEIGVETATIEFVSESGEVESTATIARDRD